VLLPLLHVHTLALLLPPPKLPLLLLPASLPSPRLLLLLLPALCLSGMT
jgi:hypothetical protein